jgi:Putative Ig domain
MEPSISAFSATVDWADGSAAFTATSGNAGIVDNLDGTFSVVASHTFAAYGQYSVQVAIADSVYSCSVNVTSTATISNPITLSNPGTQNKTEGDSVTLSITATDAGSATLTFMAQDLPPGLVIDPSSGVITGTVAIGSAASGPYLTVVTVTNGSYVASTAFTWNVSSPVSLTNPGDRTSTEGDSISLSLSASTSSGTLSYGASGLPAGLSIDPSTGAISGSIASGSAAFGPYAVTVIASTGTYSTYQTFTWTVASPVTLAAIADQTTVEGDSISLSVSATGTGTLAYTAAGLPPGMSINTSSGTLSGTLTAGAALGGPFWVIVTVGNGSYSASQSFTWSVTSPIQISTPADQSSSEGDTVSLQVSATDSASGTLSYGAVGLPAGLSIDSSSGEISGTIDTGAAANGPYYVTLLAADGTYFNSTSFSWDVTGLVTITTPADQQDTEGDSVTLQVQAVNNGTGTLSYSASGLPGGLSIDSGTGEITGTLSAGGSFAVSVTASNGTDSATAGFLWVVDSAVTITGPGPQAFNAGGVVSVQVQASTTGMGSLSYSASGLPTGLSINSSSGLISGTIDTGVSPDIYTSTITVTDGTSTAQLVVDWTIYPVSQVVLTNPGAQSDDEGDSVSLSLSVSYSGSGTVVYSALGLPPGLVLDPSTGDISGTVGLNASGSGQYTVMVTATDGTDSDSQTFVWTITSPITLTNPGDRSNDEGDSVSLSLSASYGGMGSLSYAAFGLPAGLVLNTSTGAITGNVAAGTWASGPYSVTVQAAADGHVTQQSFTWTINSPITITGPGDQTNDEGDSVTVSVSASGSGTLSYLASGLPFGLSIDPDSGDITGTVAVGAVGSYTVTLTVSNDTAYATSNLNWTVSDSVSIDNPGDQTSREGDTIYLPIDASTTGMGTLLYGALGLPGGLVIDPDTGIITGTIAAGAADDGPYYVLVGVTDGTTIDFTSFSWTVNGAIVIDDPGDQTGDEDDVVSLTVTATNYAGGSLTWSADDLPDGLSINSSSGAITGTLTAGGFWVTTVTATNGTYGDSVSFYWDVTSLVSIEHECGCSLPHNEGESVSLQIMASTTGTGTLSYSATGLPAGVSINSSTGEISGTIASGAAANGPYTVVVTVTDGTSTAIDSFTWQVNGAGPVVLGKAGSLSSTAGDQLAFFLDAQDQNSGTLMYSATGLPEGMYINPVTGLVFGTVDLGADSATPYQVTITASDGTDQASQTFEWTIDSLGPLYLANPGDQRGAEGDSVSVSLDSTYTGSGTVYYLALGLPAGLSIDPDTGDITGTLATGTAEFGDFYVTVLATDGTSSATQTFVWKVTSPVTVTTPDDQTSSEGDSVSLQIDADATSGTLVYAASGLPAGLSIDPGTGEITGTVAAGAADAGWYFVTVVVSNGTSTTSSAFYWDVSGSVSITTPDDQDSSEGDSVSLSVAASTTGMGSLSYAAFGLPAGLSIDPSSGVISGTIAGGAGDIGWFTPTIVVSDGTSSSSTTFTWTVGNAITLDGLGNQWSSTGESITLNVGASYTGSGSLTYTASGLPLGLSIDTATGAITGTISTAAADIATFTTVVTVTDGSSNMSETLVWTVDAAGDILLSSPGDQSGDEADSVSLGLSASYTGSGDLVFFAFGLPPGLAIDPATGDITGTVAVNDALYGPYYVTVIATDGTSSDWKSFTWSLSGPLTVSTVADQTGTEGGSVSLSVGSVYTGSGTPVYSAEGLPAGLVIDPDTGAITGTLAVGAAGSYFATVTATDGTSSSSQSFAWTVDSPITLAVPDDQNSVEGDSVALSLSVSYSGSGTLSYSAVGLPAGLMIDTTTGQITGTVAAGIAEAGPSAVTVTASDGTSSTTKTSYWDISNPITIKDADVQSFSQGDSVSVQVQANYAGTGTLFFSAFNLPSGLSIDSATGVITGIIDEVVGTVGYLSSSIEASDGIYSSYQKLVWQVTSTVFHLVNFALLTPAPQPIPSGTATFVAIAPGSSWVAWAQDFSLEVQGGRIWLQDIREKVYVEVCTGETIKAIALRAEGVRGDTGVLLATITENNARTVNTLSVWRIEANKKPQLLFKKANPAGVKREVAGVTFVEATDSVAVVSGDNGPLFVQFFSATTGKAGTKFVDKQNGPPALGFGVSDSSKYLLVTQYGSVTILWLDKGVPKFATETFKGNSVSAALFSNFLVYAEDSGDFAVDILNNTIFEQPGTQAFQQFEKYTGTNGLVAVAVDRTGRYIITGNKNRLIQAWDLKTGKKVGKPLKLTHAITAIVISDDNQYFFTAGGSISTSGPYPLFTTLGIP